MSTSTWKNVVLGIQRIPLGTGAGRVSGGPSHSGAWIASSGPKRATPSSWWVIMTYRIPARSSGSSARHSPMLLNTRTIPGSTSLRPSNSTCSFHLLKCGVPIQIAWSMPRVDEAPGPAVDERVLARPRAEALAEQDELRPLPLGDPSQPRPQRVEQHPRLRPALVDTVEREDRRSRRVLHRDGRAVTAGEELESP